MRTKRHFNELCASLAHSTNARNVFVEGITDARILSKAFIDCGRTDIYCYAVDSIDFSGVNGAPNSNRAKCILISEMLAERCRDDAAGKAVCVIDSDFDLYDGTDKSSEFLVCTEHADLILYFARADVLEYFCSHIFGDNVSISEILQQVIDACKVFFAARHSIQSIDRTIGFVQDVSRACEIEGSRIVVNVTRLVAQILSPYKALPRTGELALRIEEFPFRDHIPSTAQMCGHDFVQVLRFAPIQFGRGRFSGAVPETAVEAMIYGAQRAADLCSSALIKSIFARVP